MVDRVGYSMAFSHMLGIGPLKYQGLMKAFRSEDEAYNADPNKLLPLLGSSLLEKFIHFRRNFNIDSKLETIRLKNIHVITQKDKNYPRSILNIDDPPICIYVKGENLSLLNDEYLFAIVGTRQPTSYGAQVASIFASGLSARGFTIVSGLALGIDAISHTICLDNKGKTIAVLGCGVDLIYPQENSFIYKRILRSRNLIISEFPPGMTVKKGLFVARNRLISGLSRGVMIVEGTKDSGSLITARYAAAQGKDVFAPPCPITSQMSEAPNLLLKQGARLVTSVDDILDEMQLTVSPKILTSFEEKLGPLGKTVFEILKRESMGVDQLKNILKISVQDILPVLSNMELGGILDRDAEGKYLLKNN